MATSRVEFVSSIPPGIAGAQEVRKWLASWFTTRDLKTSKIKSDVTLRDVLGRLNLTRYDIQIMESADLRQLLEATLMPDYVVDQLQDMILEARNTYTQASAEEDFLPAKAARDLFIRSLPLPDASPERNLAWLLTWFSDGKIDIKDTCAYIWLISQTWDSGSLRTRTDPITSGLSPNTNELAIFDKIDEGLQDKGIGYKQVWYFARDVTAALKMEEERNKESSESKKRKR